MAKLVKILKGQSVTEQLDAINTSVENINKELEQVTSNENGFITEDEIPVKSVQGKTGDVSLSAKDVGAFPNSSTIKELDINNLKSTGVYIGTYAGNPYYLVVIKYNDTNIYQELIGLNFKKYRRFTTTWSEWIQEYSNENPVKASDITGINIVDTDKELTLALLEDTTFVKADIKYNPSTKSLYVGDDKFATEQFVRNAVNMIQSIIVTELPSVGVENTIYFVPTGAEGGNIFNEYLYVNNAWEIVGGTSVDLTPFLTKEEAEQTYAKISSLDDKVSKTTTINGKTLYNNITLTAEDVGALSKDTILVEDVVYRHTNEEISGKLTAGAFVENDLVIAIDTGTYLQGHMYKYNSGTLTDITDIITDYVDLNSDQNINGTKNFNGVLRYGGVNVATEEDLNEYLPLSGGTLTVASGSVALTVKSSNNNSFLKFAGANGTLGHLGVNYNKKPIFYDTEQKELALKSDLDDYLPLSAGSDKKLTGDLYSTKDIILSNNQALRGKDTSGNNYRLLEVSTTNNVWVNYDNLGKTIIGGTAIQPFSANHQVTDLGIATASFRNIYGKTIYQNGKQVANAEDIPDVSGKLTGTKFATNASFNTYIPYTESSSGNTSPTYIATFVNNNAKNGLTYSSVSNLKTQMGIPNFVTLTQAEYDALSTKDANTYYFIKEE